MGKESFQRGLAHRTHLKEVNSRRLEWAWLVKWFLYFWTWMKTSASRGQTCLPRLASVWAQPHHLTMKFKSCLPKRKASKVAAFSRTKLASLNQPNSLLYKIMLLGLCDPPTHKIIHGFLSWCVSLKVIQSCPTLCSPIDYTVHGILQARMLAWVAFLFPRGSSQPRDRTQVSWIAGKFFTSWATREAHSFPY